jgi:hypothetical protein
VIQRGRRSRFVDEPFLDHLVHLLVWQWKLERHCAAKLKILGGIHNAHSTGGEIVLHAEVRDVFPDDAEWIARIRSSYRRRRRRIESGVYLSANVCEKQALDGVAKVWVLRADLIESRGARIAVELDELIEERASLLPQRAVEHFLAVELCGEPCASRAQVSFYCSERHIHGGGNFLEREATKISLFDHQRLSFVELLESRERFVELGYSVAVDLGEPCLFVQLTEYSSLAAFGGSAFSRIVDEYAPHHA